MSPKNLSDLKPDPQNPNRMADEDKARMARALAEFGDLSGIIFNRQTGLLIGGHQRASVMQEGQIVITENLDPAERDGTVARGYIDHLGARYIYREVDWSPERAHAAMLAANRFGRVGEDDLPMLKDVLQEIDTGLIEMDLTGFDSVHLEKLMTAAADVPPESSVDPSLPDISCYTDRHGGPWQHHLILASELSVQCKTEIMQWKTQNVKKITESIADAILAWIPCSKGLDLITTAPEKLERAPGYHPSTNLAKLIADRLSVPFVACFAKRIMHRRPGAFGESVEPVPTFTFSNQTVLLVDDVLCSGNTMRTCLASLRARNMAFGIAWAKWDSALQDDAQLLP